MTPRIWGTISAGRRNLLAGMRAGARRRCWRRSVERHGLYPWFSDMIERLVDPSDLMAAGLDEL